MACSNFGGECSSHLHYLDEPPENYCFTCQCSNMIKLEEFIRAKVDFSMLWKDNPGGGWLCKDGSLLHPQSDRCCCGETRVAAITSTLFFLGSMVDKKKRKHNIRLFQ